MGSAFERRPREILLGGDLLGQHVISIAEARLADLVETASPGEGEEIIRTVGQDRDLEVDDLLEVLLPEKWRTLVRHAPPGPAQAARTVPEEGAPPA